MDRIDLASLPPTAPTVLETLADNHTPMTVRAIVRTTGVPERHVRAVIAHLQPHLINAIPIVATDRPTAQGWRLTAAGRAEARTAAARR